jgi:hypothetical protein
LISAYPMNDLLQWLPVNRCADTNKLSFPRKREPNVCPERTPGL